MSSIELYRVEIDINPKAAHFLDALWRTVITAATVGYGDVYPITWQGRVVGMRLMIFGIGLVGTVSDLVSDQLLAKHERHNYNE